MNEIGRACGMYGGRRSAYRVLVGNLRARDHLEDLRIYGKIQLKWIFKKLDGRAWTRLISFRIQRSGGLL
jgi:hypothetical protein